MPSGVFAHAMEKAKPGRVKPRFDNAKKKRQRAYGQWLAERQGRQQNRRKVKRP